IEYPLSLMVALVVLCRHWLSRIFIVVFFAMGILASMWLFSQVPNSEILHQKRNFFGVKRVVQWNHPKAKVLMHGSTIHGAEENSTRLFTTYYQDLGSLFTLLKLQKNDALNVVIAGLGTGNMACFAQKK